MNTYKLILLSILAMLLAVTPISAQDNSKSKVVVHDEIVRLEGYGEATLRTEDHGTYKVSYLLPLVDASLERDQSETLNQFQEMQTQNTASNPQPNDLISNIRRTGSQKSSDGLAKSFTSLNVTKSVSNATTRFKVTNAYSSLSFYNSGNADEVTLNNQICFEGISITISFPPSVTISDQCATLGPIINPNTAFANISNSGHEASGSNFYYSLRAVRQTDANFARKSGTTSAATSTARITIFDQ